MSEMQSTLFGDKSRFAIEIRYDAAHVPGQPLHGFFLYWIDGSEVWNPSWSDLTDVFFAMKWMHGDCGRRDGGELCAQSPDTIVRWWIAVMHDEGEEEYRKFEIPDLPLDVVRFSLLFHPVNGPDTILLLSCNGNGMLIYDALGESDLVVINDRIEQFERPIVEAYEFLNAMHERLGI